MGDAIFTRRFSVLETIIPPTVNFVSKGTTTISFTLTNNYTKTVDVYWEEGNSNPVTNFVSLEPDETSTTIEITGLTLNTTYTIFAVSQSGSNRSAISSLTETTLNLVQGLRYTWYNTGGEFSSFSHPLTAAQLDNFFNPARSGVSFGGSGFHTTNINFADTTTSAAGGTTGPKPSYLPANAYSWMVEGFIFAPTTGTYTFGVSSDDAADVFVNGQNVAFWYGGHGFSTGWNTSSGQVAGQITLQGGQFYSFRARFEEGSGGDGIQVGWRRPTDGSIALIPASAFFRTP